MKKFGVQLVTVAAIAGNLLYILWIFTNGMDDSFGGTPVMLASFVGIILLLALDAVLLFRALTSDR